MKESFNRENLEYRQGVNGIVMDEEGNYLLVQKNVYGEGQWAFPGGGLDKDEDLEVGLLRELEEELGTDKFKILKKSSIVNQYEWPEGIILDYIKTRGEEYRGQQKHQYIVLFTGKKDEIKIQEEEIRKIKWVTYQDLKTHLVFPDQWENIKKVIGEFNT